MATITSVRTASTNRATSRIFESRFSGLDPRREVVFIEVNGYGGDLWQFSPKSPDWTVGFRRKKASRTADLFLEPYRVETGRSFNLVVRYDDGTKVEIAFNGRRADPNLRMPGAPPCPPDGSDKTVRTGLEPGRLSDLMVSRTLEFT